MVATIWGYVSRKTWGNVVPKKAPSISTGQANDKQQTLVLLGRVIHLLATGTEEFDRTHVRKVRLSDRKQVLVVAVDSRTGPVSASLVF